MSRPLKLFIITHLYPLFMVCHMKFGNSGLFSILLFQVVPIVFVFGLLAEWKATSSIKLAWYERQYINYFIFCFCILHLYYVACLLESPAWVKTHNQYFFCYGLITFTFYTYIHVARKLKYR